MTTINFDLYQGGLKKIVKLSTSLKDFRKSDFGVKNNIFGINLKF